MKTYEEIFGDLQTVLVVVAHPDDLDVYFGGLVARLKEDGKKISIFIATNGANGGKEIDNSLSLGLQREKEQMLSLECLGLTKENLQILNYTDGKTFSKSEELLHDVVRKIREVKPDIVCTHAPDIIYSHSEKLKGYFVNHVDHRSVGTAVIDAVYPFSRNPAFFKDKNTEVHEVRKIYVTCDQIPSANSKIEITNVIDKKKSAILSHKSQFSEAEVESILNEENKEGDKYFELGEYINLLV